MVLPKFRFFLTLGTISIEVYPYDFSKTKFVEEQVAKQVFFREKLKGNLVFLNVNKDGVADFDLFWGIELGTSVTFPGANQCTTFSLEIRKLCAGEYVTRWTGRFSTGSGKIDYDNCRFEVNPEVVDRYTCIMDLMKVDFNVLDGTLAPNCYQSKAPGGVLHELRHVQYREIGTVIGDCTGCFEQTIDTWYLDGVVVAPPADVNDWCLFDNGTLYGMTPCCPASGNGQFGTETETWIYRRYELTTNCAGGIGGTPAPPDNTWTLLTDDCPTLGTATFWRCTTADFEFNRLKKLTEVLDAIIDQSSCTLVLSSIFLNWNPDTLDPYYEQTFDGLNYMKLNYVTGAYSWTNHIMISQKRDIKIPNATNPSTIAITTFKNLLERLRVIFNCYWDIDDDGIFRIEHIKYWRTKNSVIDMRIAGVVFNKRKNEYEHLKSQIPNREWFRFMEGSPDGAGDFADNAIIYSDTCSEFNLEESNTAEDVTTNLEYIADYPDDIDDTGFVWLSTDFDGTDYLVNYEVGLLSGSVKPNAHLSWANLLYNYHRYERYLSSGTMNGNAETFFTWRPNIKQVQLSLLHCCDDPEFNAEELFDTALGQLFGGKKGYVESAEHPNDNSELINIIFKYSI